MSQIRGICTNFGFCERAEAGQPITLPAGSEPVCPECGKLMPEVSGGAPGRKPVLAAGGAVALGALIVVFGKSVEGGSPPDG